MNRFQIFVVTATLFVSGCAPQSSHAPATGRKPDFGQTQQHLLGSPFITANIFNPFEERGKLQINNSNLEHASELAVTLRAPCDNPGWLTNSVLNSQTPRVEQVSSIYSYVWKVPAHVAITDIEQEALADHCVVGITHSTRYTLNSLPNDPDAANEGHLTAIEASSAFDVIFEVPFVALKPVVIAIIDTGVDLVHPDLQNVLWTNPGEIPSNGIDDDHNGYIDDVHGYNIADNQPSPQTLGWSGSEHGTHVAGLAAAEGGNGIGITGVMGKGAVIMAVNVFGTFHSSLVTDLANAVRYAADNGADVINLSVGGEGGNATYEAALGYAVSKGVTVVVAAGNDGKELGGGFFQSPSMYAREFPGMLSVASTDSETGEFSYFSNRNPDYVKISAPGAENARARKGLLSTWPGNQYHRIQGTSMASPVVAGAASVAISMLRARGYAPSPATIERILTRSSVNNESLKDKVQDGRALNMRQLVDYITRNYQPQY